MGKNGVSSDFFNEMPKLKKIELTPFFSIVYFIKNLVK